MQDSMHSPKPGRSLELFFIDGSAEGMLAAEVFNWTGHVLRFPRTRLQEALRRAEATFAGAYILLGEDENGDSLAYVGESEELGHRIRTHDTQKDWWDTAVLITTTAGNLNKAHVRYLESRLVAEARLVGRANLKNGTTPSLARLSESGRANMEAFLEYVFLVLPAIRVDLFVQRTRPSSLSGLGGLSSDGPVETFELRTPRWGVHGTARLVEGEFVVEQGSVVLGAISKTAQRDIERVLA